MKLIGYYNLVFTAKSIKKIPVQNKGKIQEIAKNL